MGLVSNQDRRRARARAPGLPGGPLRGREVNMAGAMQPQEQARQIGVAGRIPFGCRHPGLAQREGQRPPAEAWRRGEPRPNRGGGIIGVITRPRYVTVRCTTRERSKPPRRTQVRSPVTPSPDPAPHRRGIARRRVAPHDQSLQLMRLQRRRRRPTRRPPRKRPRESRF